MDPDFWRDEEFRRGRGAMLKDVSSIYAREDLSDRVSLADEYERVRVCENVEVAHGGGGGGPPAGEGAMGGL